jgi:hypothetical protein
MEIPYPKNVPQLRISKLQIQEVNGAKREREDVLFTIVKN